MVSVLFLLIGFTGCDNKSSSSSTSSTTPADKFFYVTDNSGGSPGNIYHCTLKGSDQSVNTCAVSNGGASWYPMSITTATIGSNTFAYVPSYDLSTTGDVYKCTVSSTDGTLSSCAPSDGGIASSAWRPSNVYVTDLSGTYYAYVAEQNGHVYRCSVDSTTGALSSCASNDGGATFTAPAWVVLATVGGNLYAYIADYVNPSGHIYKCSVNSTGVFSGCTLSDEGASGWLTGGINVQTISSTTYAYVSDNNGNIYVCTVNSGTGALSGCTVSDNGEASWEPNSSDIYSSGSSYYIFIGSIADSNIYRCQLSSADGTLSGCTTTDGGISVWTPYGVEF